MARLGAAGQRVQVPRPINEKTPIVSIQDFLEGLVTDRDPSKIPDNALTIADNFDYFRSMPFRRNGLVAWAITKPDSSRILNIFPYFETTTGLNILRFTKSTIYRSGVGGFTQFTPSVISANSGGDSDYFTFGVIDNRMFFSNGVDPIREVDAVAHQYKAVGNAPIYKYICAAFDRIIGAFLVDSPDIGYQVGWCGESNYTEWNPTVDISAGLQNLTSSATSLSDNCTGILFTGQILIVPREHSIWIGQHTPSSTEPFSFFSGLNKIGADIPRTIQLTDYGLAWVSNKASAVYVWQPGTVVTKLEDIEITNKVKRALRVALNNALAVWASYGTETRIYSIFIANGSTSVVTVFNYNFYYNTWTISEIDGQITSAYDIEYGNSALAIDDLSGTISALAGTIDSLGALQQNATRVFGYNTGEMATQSPFSGLADESGNIITTDNGMSFDSTLGIKILENPLFETHQNVVRMDITPYNTGTVTLWYSKDDGNTWVQAKQVTFTTTYRAQFLLHKRSLRARRVTWKVTTSDCMCAINGFYAYVEKGGVASLNG